MTGRELLAFRARAFKRNGWRASAPAVLVALAAAGASEWVRRGNPDVTAATLGDAAFWAGTLIASIAGFLSLDRALLSDEPRRLVALGVDPRAVARYHVGRSVAAIGTPLLLAIATALPWLRMMPEASAHVLFLLVVPALTAALVGPAAHAYAGEALEGERTQRLKRALGGKFGGAEAAPLLYSGAAPLALAGIGGIFVNASFRDIARGLSPEPLIAVLCVHAVVCVVAVVKTIRIYRRSFLRIVPSILEVAAPWAGPAGEAPRLTASARLATRLGALTGAIAARDLTQVRRAHWLDRPFRFAAIGAAALWLSSTSAPHIGLLVGLAWGLLVAIALPTAARATSPSLAPTWVERSLALAGSRVSLLAGIAAGLIVDAPVILVLGLLVAWRAGVAPALVAAAVALVASACVHGVGRLGGLAAGRFVAVGMALALWISVSGGTP